MNYLLGKLTITAVISIGGTGNAVISGPVMRIPSVPSLKPLATSLTLQSPVQPVAPPAPPKIITANTYEPGQCTWYVKNLRPEIPDTWHNARQWLGNARGMGWPTGSVPRVNAVAWEIGGGSFGHVALVTAVSGAMVSLTEMNEHYIPYQIDSRTVPASEFLYIY